MDRLLDKYCARLIEVAQTLDHATGVAIRGEDLPEDVSVILYTDKPPAMLLGSEKVRLIDLAYDWIECNAKTREEDESWRVLRRVMNHCWNIIKDKNYESSVRSAGCSAGYNADDGLGSPVDDNSEERGDLEMTEEARWDRFKGLESRVASLEKMAGELYGKTSENARKIEAKVRDMNGSEALKEFENQLMDIGNTPIQDHPRIYRLQAGSALVILWIKGWDVKVNLPGDDALLGSKELKEVLAHGDFELGRAYLEKLCETLDGWCQHIDARCLPDWNGVKVELME